MRSIVIAAGLMAMSAGLASTAAMAADLTQSSDYNDRLGGYETQSSPYDDPRYAAIYGRSDDISYPRQSYDNRSGSYRDYDYDYDNESDGAYQAGSWEGFGGSADSSAGDRDQCDRDGEQRFARRANPTRTVGAAIIASILPRLRRSTKIRRDADTQMARPSNGKCLSQTVIRRNLRRNGWQAFELIRLQAKWADMSARQSNGNRYEIRVDRCSGAILSERLVNRTARDSFAAR